MSGSVGAAGSPPPSGLPPISQVEGLSPEYILARVRAQLQDMDRQARVSMRYIDDKQREAEQLGRKIQELRDLDSAIRDDDHAYDGEGEIWAIELNDEDSDALADYLGLDTHAPDGTRISDTVVRERFAAAMAEYGITVEDEHFDTNVIKNKIDNLLEEQRQLNAGNEMLMMHLQNLMQQRSQALQAGSNALASIHDAAKTIAGNIR